MRTFLLFLSLQCMAYIVQAQSVFVGKDSIVINNVTYTCDTSESVTYVARKQNITNQITFHMRYVSERCEDADVIDNVLETAINFVLTSTRRAALKNVHITIYIKPETGVIEEVRFFIPVSSSITPEEVYALEQSLKGKVMNPQPYCVPMRFTALSIRL